MQLFGAAMREYEKSVPPGPANGKDQYLARRASTMHELSWFGASQYVEHRMWLPDIESNHSLTFEGSEWMFKEPAGRDESETWAYRRQRYRVELAGSYSIIPARY